MSAKTLAMNTIAPEYETVDAFVAYLLDDDRTTATIADVEALCFAQKRTSRVIIDELATYGVTMAQREPTKRVRGFGANNHDRWSGPGSCASHGGSGHEQITGFAGRAA